MHYSNNSSQSPQSNAQPNAQLGDNGESDALVRQARNSAGGFDYGSDRAIGNPPNWAAQQSDQLYRGATQNNDPSSAEATGQLWKAHGEELHQAANDLYGAISELGNAWVGRGSGSAQGALVGIANASRQAGDAAHSMASRLAQQASAAAEVKKMPAPKNFDPGQQTASMLAGGPVAMVADMKQQADEADAVHAQQVQYFNAYTQAMSEVDGTTPSFGPESLGMPGSGNISVTGASAVGGVSGGAGAYGAGSAGPIGAGYGGGDAGGSDAGQGAPGGPSGGAGQPGLAGAAGAGSASAHGAGAVPVPGSSSGHGAAAALGAGLGIAGAGLGAAAGKAVLGRGNKSGAKTDDATDAASVQEAEHRAQGSMQNQPLMNSQGTIGGGAQNNAAAPPAGGMGGMGGMHGGQGEEDKEHNRASYLIEADPDAAFGAGTATPPPVIGAWEDED